MKKYATVETEKSTRIFMIAFTWFLRRTVPSSRKAKPACIASTITAPSRMKRTSADVLRPCMGISRARRGSPAPPILAERLAQEAAQLVAEALELRELLPDQRPRAPLLLAIEHGEEALPFAVRLAEERAALLHDLLLRARDLVHVGRGLRELRGDARLELQRAQSHRDERALRRAHRDVELRFLHGIEPQRALEVVEAGEARRVRECRPEEEQRGGEDEADPQHRSILPPKGRHRQCV